MLISTNNSMPMKKMFFLLGFALIFTISGLYFFTKERVIHYFLASSAGPEKPTNPDSLNYVPGFGKIPLSTQEQFNLFPLPQFVTGHPLNANFLWMDPSYFGGNGQEGINVSTAIANSVFIQEQLARYWNYSVIVNNNTKIFNKYKEPNSFIYAWVKLANEHPEWPSAAITFWGQVRPRHLNDSLCNGDRGYIGRTNMQDSLYLTYEPGANHKTKRINPAAHPSNFYCDGLTQQKYIQELLGALTRPLNYINENGEVFHLLDNAKLENDERVTKDKKNFPSLSTYQYQSKKRLILEELYRDVFFKDKRLSSTHYSVYAVDGFEKYRHDYAIMRKIQSPLNGMHYSTPDFYPRWPNNWRRMQGPWHGLEWIEVCRDKETALGDHLFSPFVAAGWDKDETINIPPGQWLGLLKILNVFGAEFFYTGYFNEKMPPNDPRSYCWQSVMPAYSQAVFSHCPEVLLKGTTQKEKQWFLQSNREDVVALVRKHQYKEQYVMAITLQHKTNNASNPNKTNVTLNWGEIEIQVEARVQGSVYFIDLSDRKKPVVVILDQWHQWEHPARWEKEHWVDAAIVAEQRKVESKFPHANNKWNLHELSSAIKLSKGENFNFHWQQRLNEKAEQLLLDLSNCEDGSMVGLYENEELVQQYPLKVGINILELAGPLVRQEKLNLSLRVINGNIGLNKWKLKCRKV
jgi:hypothetical protein